MLRSRPSHRRTVLTDAHRELQQLIDSTNDESSPFHISHAAYSTNPTVHPPPTLTEEGPDVKKRKLHSNDTNGVLTTGLTLSNDVRHAVYPSLVTANQHIDKVHAIVKKECEQLADSCVSSMCPSTAKCDHTWFSGQSETLGQLVHAQVRHPRRVVRSGANRRRVVRIEECVDVYSKRSS